jgi:hypothetical protein
MFVAAMLAYHYTRSYSTMANVAPSSYPYDRCRSRKPLSDANPPR